MFQPENFVGIVLHDTQSDEKFKKKVTHGLKNDINNLVNFHASSRKSKILNIDRLLLSEAYKVSDEKVQKKYVL